MKKIKMTPTQTQILMEMFEANAYPEKEQQDNLAMLLNITKTRIECWFKNMRKKKAAEGILKKG